MVGANDSETVVARVTAPSLVPAGGRFEGRVVGRDGTRIDGRVIGPVHVDGHLLAGREALIEGDVETGDLTLAGRVEGEVCVRRRAHLQPGATVRGTLRAAGLRMEEGARLEGRCRTGEPETEPDSRS